MSPREERHWLGEGKDSAVFLEGDLGLREGDSRLFRLPIRILILPTQEADQVGVYLERSRRIAILAIPVARAAGGEVMPRTILINNRMVVFYI